MQNLSCVVSLQSNHKLVDCYMMFMQIFASVVFYLSGKLLLQVIELIYDLLMNTFLLWQYAQNLLSLRMLFSSYEMSPSISSCFIHPLRVKYVISSAILSCHQILKNNQEKSQEPVLFEFIGLHQPTNPKGIGHIQCNMVP